MTPTKDRVKQILQGCCAGNATLATDILHEEFVIIARADLPEVNASVHDPNSYRTDGESVVYTSAENARMWVMRDVAVWQFIEQRDEQLRTRRDELAAEFTAVNSYSGQLPYTQNLIDRIIELEKKAKTV